MEHGKFVLMWLSALARARSTMDLYSAGFDGDCLLKETIEKLASALRSAAVEAECKLVQVRGKTLSELLPRVHCSNAGYWEAKPYILGLPERNTLMF